MRTRKTPVVREQRELTVYNLPGGNLIEFASLLKPDHGKVKLDGDPEHAGFQFRAHNDVRSGNEKQTYYLRPTGKGEFGQEQHGKKDLPWDAASFVLKGQRYTVGYLDQPEEPASGNVERAGLWPIRLLLQTGDHARKARCAQLPHLAAAGRNDRRAGAGTGRTLCVAADRGEVTDVAILCGRCTPRRGAQSAARKGNPLLRASGSFSTCATTSGSRSHDRQRVAVPEKKGGQRWPPFLCKNHPLPFPKKRWN